MHDFFEIFPYCISGTACLILGIALLCIKTFPLSLNKNYQRIKSFLAYSAFIDVFIDVLIIIAVR